MPLDRCFTVGRVAFGPPKTFDDHAAVRPLDLLVDRVKATLAPSGETNVRVLQQRVALLEAAIRRVLGGEMTHEQALHALRAVLGE